LKIKIEENGSEKLGEMAQEEGPLFAVRCPKLRKWGDVEENY
jgi:hypothetical protein